MELNILYCYFLLSYQFFVLPFEWMRRLSWIFVEIDFKLKEKLFDFHWQGSWEKFEAGRLIVDRGREQIYWNICVLGVLRGPWTIGALRDLSFVAFMIKWIDLKLLKAVLAFWIGLFVSVPQKSLKS